MNDEDGLCEKGSVEKFADQGKQESRFESCDGETEIIWDRQHVWLVDWSIRIFRDVEKP